MLILLAAVCAAPVLASYFMYYVVKPTGGTTSYGALKFLRKTWIGKSRASWMFRWMQK